MNENATRFTFKSGVCIPNQIETSRMHIDCSSDILHISSCLERLSEKCLIKFQINQKNTKLVREDAASTDEHLGNPYYPVYSPSTSTSLKWHGSKATSPSSCSTSISAFPSTKPGRWLFETTFWSETFHTKLPVAEEQWSSTESEVSWLFSFNRVVFVAVLFYVVNVRKRLGGHTSWNG